MKLTKTDYMNGFRSYDSDITYRTIANYQIINYRAFCQKQYKMARNVIVDDLHTIVDKICDFTN